MRDMRDMRDEEFQKSLNIVISTQTFFWLTPILLQVRTKLRCRKDYARSSLSRRVDGRRYHILRQFLAKAKVPSLKGLFNPSGKQTKAQGHGARDAQNEGPAR